MQTSDWDKDLIVSKADNPLVSESLSKFMEREISITMPRTNLVHHEKISIIPLKRRPCFKISRAFAAPTHFASSLLWYCLFEYHNPITPKKPAFLLVSAANSLLATTLKAARRIQYPVGKHLAGCEMSARLSASNTMADILRNDYDG